MLPYIARGLQERHSMNRGHEQYTAQESWTSFALCCVLIPVSFTYSLQGFFTDTGAII